jgi:hypothetical protein
LAASETCPFGTPYQNSTFGTDVRDFVVANGSQYGNVYHHARVTNFSGSDQYRLEARNVSIDVAVGSTVNQSFASFEIMDLYEAALTSGKTYAAVADPATGTADLDLFAFAGSRFNGRRADNDGSAQSAAAGTAETLVFTAAETSIYGFAVTNENFATTDYTFKIWLKPLVNAIANHSHGCTSYTGPTPSLAEGSTPVVWSLDAGPAGMTIDSSTGVVSWPSPNTGVWLVTIRATNPAGFDTESWNVTVDCPVIQSVASVKLHGAVAYGIPFIGETITNPGGATSLSVECRANGVTQAVFVFDAPVTAVDGAINAGSEVTVGGGAITSLDLSVPGTIKVNMTTTNQNGSCVRVRLTDIVKVAGGGPMATTTASIVALRGDVTGNNVVDIGDINAVKAASGVGLNSSAVAFRRDVTANGAIDIGDVNNVKSLSGNALVGACP